MRFRTLDRLDCAGKYVIVRVNYDIQFDEQGNIRDDLRIRKSLPTLQYLLKQGATKLVLVTQLGRPKAGQFDPKFSLAPVAGHLGKLVEETVGFVPEWDLLKVQRAQLPLHRIVLLENVRFSPGEKSNDPVFGKHLASLADCYVDDAFPTIHRPDASFVGIPQYIPGAAGLLVAEELTKLAPLLHPQQPYVAYIAGGKADKLGAVDDLARKTTRILIGGALANTFLMAKGTPIGASKYDPDGVRVAKALLDKHGDKLLLPVDALILASDGSTSVCRTGSYPEEGKAVDVGPQTLLAYHAALHGVKTLLWCGPPGMFDKGFEIGTKAFAQLVLEATRAGAYTVVGGGESSEAAVRYGIADKISFNSTGGGATLEFAQGKPLPGIVALEQNLRKFK